MHRGANFGDHRSRDRELRLKQNTKNVIFGMKIY